MKSLHTFVQLQVITKIPTLLQRYLLVEAMVDLPEVAMVDLADLLEEDTVDLVDLLEEAMVDLLAEATVDPEVPLVEGMVVDLEVLLVEATVDPVDLLVEGMVDLVDLLVEVTVDPGQEVVLEDPEDLLLDMDHPEVELEDLLLDMGHPEVELEDLLADSELNPHFQELDLQDQLLPLQGLVAVASIHSMLRTAPSLVSSLETF